MLMCPADGWCTRTRYLSGCRGYGCLEAERNYKADYRRRRRQQAETNGQLQSVLRLFVEDVPFSVDAAACHGTEVDYFDEWNPDAVAAAKRLCTTCPVLDECRTHAVTNREPIGIWGGLTTRERIYLRSSLKRAQ